MSILVVLVTTLFFIGLTMLAASVFTPRTAIFFKEKTRARGALVWLLVIGACVLLLDYMAPDSSFIPRPKNTVVGQAPDYLPSIRRMVSGHGT